MAEGETKTERKQIEMSIWFVVLLIAVIIFMCVFMKMKGDLDTANAKIAEQETKISSLEKTNSDRAHLILDIKKDAVDGDLSKNTVLKRLEGTEFGVDSVITTEQSSGDVSGDIPSEVPAE